MGSPKSSCKLKSDRSFLAQLYLNIDPFSCFLHFLLVLIKIKCRQSSTVLNVIQFSVSLLVPFLPKLQALNTCLLHEWMDQARFCSILCGALINVMLGMLMDSSCPSSFLSLFCFVRGSQVWAKQWLRWWSFHILWPRCHFHNFILCWLPGAYSLGHCFKSSPSGPSLFCPLKKGRMSV